MGAPSNRVVKTILERDEEKITALPPMTRPQLVDARWDECKEHRSSRLIRAVYSQTVTSQVELDLMGNRTLDRAAVASYTDYRWVGSVEVTITDPTRVEKSFPAHRAIKVESHRRLVP